MQSIWVSLPAILQVCRRLEVAEDAAQMARMQHRENAQGFSGFVSQSPGIIT